MGRRKSLRVIIHPDGVYVCDNKGGQVLLAPKNDACVAWSHKPLDFGADPMERGFSQQGRLSRLLVSLTFLWFTYGDLPVLSWPRGLKGAAPSEARVGRMAAPGPGGGPWLELDPKDLRGQDAVVIEA